MDYSPEVRRRFELRQRAGELRRGTEGFASGEASDRALNVWVRFQVQVLQGIIRSARYQVYGCPHTVAAASWAAEWLEGRAEHSLGQLDPTAMRTALDVPVEKLGKLLLIEDALLACWQARRNGNRQNGS